MLTPRASPLSRNDQHPANRNLKPSSAAGERKLPGGASRQSIAHGKALAWLCATVFLLTAAPRAGINIGPIPIYVIDFLLLGTYLRAIALPPSIRRHRPFGGFIVAILVFVVISEAAGMVYSGRPQDPIYTLIRTLLAISIYYSASNIVRDESSILAVAKAALLGLIISATLMIATSLPFTRGLATAYVFSLSFLEPAAESVLESYADTADPERGRSLVGVSILTGAFLNSTWPLVALLFQSIKTASMWKKLAAVGLTLAPFGVVMSYSRGAIMGLLLVVATAVFFGSQGTRKGIIAAALIAVITFTFVGWDSEYFFFERIEQRTQAMIENPYEDEREYARILAYTEPFVHVQAHPQFILFGAGNGIKRWGESLPLHSMFGKAYIAYGLIAAILYHLLVFSAFAFLFRALNTLHKRAPITRTFAQALLASMMGILPWLAFGHAAISAPRGATLFFLLIGLIAAIRTIEAHGASSVKRAA